MNRHLCGWPACPKRVPSNLLMCARHWRRLPPSLRHRIWDTYKPAEPDKGGPEHSAAVRAALAWARQTAERGAVV